ncbi:17S U2 SnRNP complex component HTATSF1 [Periplaneta americana]|uniref:17S U2 SnRNP complex component HTATSF1 n=1 Tax=Periplaneta americana TaxID=6978 RepID=UPI0037E84C60
MAEDTRQVNQSSDQDAESVASEQSTPARGKEDSLKTSDETSTDLSNEEAEVHTGSSDKRDETDNPNLHYEGRVCVYTDPVSKCQYIWDSDKNEWVLRSECTKSTEDKPDKSETSKAEKESEVQTNKCPPSDKDGNNISSKDYDFDGESYCYTDSKTGVTYKYDNTKSSWVVKEPSEAKDDDESDESDEDRVIKQDMSKGTYGYEGDTHTYTDASDGTVYIWDREKNAWFPKVDEDFLAHYQMNYGFTDNSAAAAPADKEAEAKSESSEDKAALKRKAMPQDPSWFEMDEQHNTKVYVSNLPLDITEQEFVDVMQKCGLVMRDTETGKMKVKLYTEPDSSQLKGDGLCSYIKIESVDLALKLLDGYDLRGHKLHVERAKFQMKGTYDPNLKPKKRKKKDKEKLKKMQEKLFDWRPDKLRGERSKHEKVVIVKNLFEPSVFDKDVSLLLEYQQDLREECSKCGDVRRVLVYDRHPEGVAQVTFREPEEADACVALLNGRWFGQRKITAETWDGKTKYKVAETEAEIQQRLQKWDKFLQTGEVESKKGVKKPAEEGNKEGERENAA